MKNTPFLLQKSITLFKKSITRNLIYIIYANKFKGKVTLCYMKLGYRNKIKQHFSLIYWQNSHQICLKRDKCKSYYIIYSNTYLW